MHGVGVGEVKQNRRNQMNKKLTTIGLAFALAAEIAPLAGSAEPSKPFAEIKTDMPLRDPSICRGPHGTYYLTGTVSTRNGPDGKPDF